jgi:8-oxo-dGTP pyrophosphatase MutT (NUDIX family)
MKNKKYGGVLLICSTTKRVLLGQRGKEGTFPNCWSVFGGKIEDGESIIEGVKRELYEETKIDSKNIDYTLFEVQWGMGYPYHFYIGYCDKEYECNLNDENQDWGWFSINDLPKPLFPTLFSSLVRIL